MSKPRSRPVSPATKRGSVGDSARREITPSRPQPRPAVLPTFKPSQENEDEEVSSTIPVSATTPRLSQRSGNGSKKVRPRDQPLVVSVVFPRLALTARLTVSEAEMRGGVVVVRGRVSGDAEAD